MKEMLPSSGTFPGWLKGKGPLAALAAVGAAGALSFAQPLGGASAGAPQDALHASAGSGLSGFARAKEAFSNALGGASMDMLSEAGTAATPAPKAEPAGAAGSTAADKGADAAAPRKIVRAATLSVEVPDEPKGRALARAAALKAGAEIEGDTTESDDGSRSATLTLRVAPERFDALMTALEGVGRVTSRGVTTQNMSEEYVDLRSRLANSRKVEKRLDELLAFKTRKLADVLAVEKELERVGADIEQIEGRMKYIDHLAASSVVTLTLTEPTREPARTGLLADARNALVGALNTFLGTGLALLKLTCWLAALALWVVPVSLLAWKLKGWWTKTDGE